MSSDCNSPMEALKPSRTSQALAQSGQTVTELLNQIVRLNETIDRIVGSEPEPDCETALNVSPREETLVEKLDVLKDRLDGTLGRLVSTCARIDNIF